MNTGDPCMRRGRATNPWPNPRRPTASMHSGPRHASSLATGTGGFFCRKTGARHARTVECRAPKRE
jgi:hypothetical protein